MIDTDAVSLTLRAAAIDVPGRSVLLSRLEGSDQEPDLSLPTNCDGYGRVHRFSAAAHGPWPENPLPWKPARDYLGATRVPHNGAMAQVFQNAVCNWRCWYCFVPFNLLRGDPNRSGWVTVDDMVDLYFGLEERSPILDLSGGQPDLVPEWAYWTLRNLVDTGRDGDVYLWSDDNLSNDYLFRYLTDAQLEFIAQHRGYGRVGCLKGYDKDSFAFNTGAEPALFERQLHLVRRLHDLMPDMWLYITLTTPEVPNDINGKLADLAGRLHQVHPSLPHRVVPLQVFPFSPTAPRMRAAQEAALLNQHDVMARWALTLQQF